MPYCIKILTVAAAYEILLSPSTPYILYGEKMRCGRLHPAAIAITGPLGELKL
jgi:hypothetical protein